MRAASSAASRSLAAGHDLPTILYELSEEHPGGMWPDIHWGLVLRTSEAPAGSVDNFTPKPAYTYLKDWLSATPTGDDAGPGGGPGGAPDDAGPGGGAGSGDAGVEDDPTKPAGCGCQGASNSASGAHLVGLAGLAMLLRRRRMK